MSEGSQITLEDLEIEANLTEPMPFNLKQIREEAERKAVHRALRHCSDNISDAANVLGITRPTLYNMLEKYGIKL